jgi:hypothetical protein
MSVGATAAPLAFDLGIPSRSAPSGFTEAMRSGLLVWPGKILIIKLGIKYTFVFELYQMI